MAPEAMEPTENKVCVVGQGYVGLPLAKAAVDAGYTVYGYDIDRAKVDGLRNGVSPIEDVTDQDVKDMLATGRYELSSKHYALEPEYESVDVWVITVPTPLTAGAPDITYVLNAARTVAPYVKHGALVVLESTVAPGTTRGEFLAAMKSSRMGPLIPGETFMLAFSPERIDPGNKAFNFSNTMKLVAGADPRSHAMAMDFYNTICQNIYGATSMEVAETAKLLENTFRHVNIALVNELARHCHALDIDVWDVIAAASTKPYGFMPFYPGAGVGGHCLPIDPAYLSDKVKKQTGQDFHFVDLAMRINDSQPKYIVDRIADILNDASLPVKDAGILVMGYAYKPNTGDARETPARAIVDLLTARGARAIVCDPHVSADDMPWDDIDAFIDDLSELERGTYGDIDMVVVATGHDRFVDQYETIDAWCVPILDTCDAIKSQAKHVHKL